MSDLFTLSDEELLECLALSVPGAPASPALRAKILQDAWRWEPFLQRLSQFIEVNVEKARAYLELLDGDWAEKLLPTVSLIHLQGGPSTMGMDVGFVRVQAGTTFPWHRHLGQEKMLILQGQARCSDGAILEVGQVIVQQPEAHSFLVSSEEDLIFAVVTDGVEFGAP